MNVDRLEGINNYYDVIVIGSGLAGLTGANYLAKQGHSVLLLEHHYQYGGLASWFRRKFKNIFDISLHGFPGGMIKSCRKYWTQEIANSIVRLKNLRFINPEFNITTSFDKEDFTRILQETFSLPLSIIESFFEYIKKMNFYDDPSFTTKELFEQFFPGRNDVHRFLMEPMAYANGSTMDDPAITFGIVFSNFMSHGVYIFQGGSDVLISKMVAEAQRNGVQLRKLCMVEKILVSDSSEQKGVTGVQVNGKTIQCTAILSNANIKNTLITLLGENHLPLEYVTQAKAVRLNSSSCQVYIGIKEGESIPDIGDLVFTSQAKVFSNEELMDKNTSSRTFSVYYPEMRPHEGKRYAIVASLNAKWEDWESLSPLEYLQEKERLCEETIVALEKLIPDIRSKINWIEAATPKTINRYTTHMHGTSFGTKFEGLKISMELPEKVPGLFHAGSVGIIMSGWLGTINYGIIVANKIDKFLSMKSTITINHLNKNYGRNLQYNTAP